MTGDGGAADTIGRAIAALDGRDVFGSAAARLRALAAEIADVATEVRDSGESIVDDPDRQDEIRRRRQLLNDLRRKYGDDLAEVMAWHAAARVRLSELEDHDRLAAALDRDLGAARAEVEAQEELVATARRAAAPQLAAAVAAQMPALALPKARVEIEVSGAAGHDVVFRFAANPGMPLQPLAKVASGGELARAMLALRLVLTEGPPVLVFDEVDAGIGGAAALAVGRSLAAVGADHQVLVVTHLAQVAAWADAQVTVDKRVEGTPDPHAGGRGDRRGPHHRAGEDALGNTGQGHRTRPRPRASGRSASLRSRLGRSASDGRSWG